MVLLDEWQAVEDVLAAVVEGQVQPVAVKRAGGCDPFQNVLLFHLSVDFKTSLPQRFILPPTGEAHCIGVNGWIISKKRIYLGLHVVVR